jgi:hypothetical protein
MKCLVKGRHDPSRKERCDLWRQALFTIRDNSPSRQPIIPYPAGRASGWHIPGIPCLDFGELSRVATIIWSLRDKSQTGPSVIRQQGAAGIAFWWTKKGLLHRSKPRRRFRPKPLALLASRLLQKALAGWNRENQGRVVA